MGKWREGLINVKKRRRRIEVMGQRKRAFMNLKLIGFGDEEQCSGNAWMANSIGFLFSSQMNVQ